MGGVTSTSTRVPIIYVLAVPGAVKRDGQKVILSPFVSVRVVVSV